MERDDEDLVDYTVTARFVGDLIKKFFTPKLIEKKARFIINGQVKYDELMKGWSEEDIK